MQCSDPKAEVTQHLLTPSLSVTAALRSALLSALRNFMRSQTLSSTWLQEDLFLSHFSMSTELSS